MKQKFETGDQVRYAHGNTVLTCTVLGGHIDVTDLANDDYVAYTIALHDPGRPVWTLRVPAQLLTLVAKGGGLDA